MLLEATLAPYADRTRISMSGPALDIDRDCLSPIALILHEWATNAAKYGALRDGGGALSISWRLADGQVQLDWVELGNEPIELGEGTGFGTILVTTSVRQLNAEMTRKADGVEYHIRINMPATVFEQV